MTNRVDPAVLLWLCCVDTEYVLSQDIKSWVTTNDVVLGFVRMCAGGEVHTCKPLLPTRAVLSGAHMLIVVALVGQPPTLLLTMLSQWLDTCA